MIMPRHLTATATTVKGLLNNCSTWFTQSLLAEFLCTDAFGRHLRSIRTIYALRRNCLVNALEHHFKGSDISGAQAGMHLVWHLPDGLPSAFELERSEERRLGKEGVSPCRSWWST